MGGLEKERPAEIAQAVAHDEECVGGDLLGVAGCVGGGERHGERPGGCVAEGEPEADQAAVGVAGREGIEPDDANEEGKEEEEHH